MSGLAVSDRLLIRRVELATTLADACGDDPAQARQEGRVIATGRGKRLDGNALGLSVALGDRVQFSMRAGERASRASSFASRARPT